MRSLKWKKHNLFLILILIGMFCYSGALAQNESEEVSTTPNSLTSLFTEGKFSGVIKTLLFDRNFDSEKTDWSTLAIGGNLNFETAPFYGFSGGVGFKTSQGDLLNNDDKNIYSGLLAPGDDPNDGESYAALDEYFLRYNNWDTALTLGAFSMSTPWMSGFDLRMTPKKYRGVSLTNNSFENVKLHGYYITDWLDWTSESWDSIASGLSGNEDDDEDSIIGGIVWQTTDSLKIQAWDFYFDEVLNAIYGRLDYSYKFTDSYAFATNLKYLDQRDVGVGLSGDLNTYMGGGDVSLAGYGAKLTLYYGAVGDDAIENPFGGDYVVIMQTKWLERAEEEVWGIKLDYNFDKVGLTGLSAYLYFANFDTPDTGENASTDMDELDLNIQYKFSGWLEDLILKFRYAHVNQDEDVADGNDWDDIRFYIEYRF